jgi:putative peptidoglycan lipid II flippase
MQITQGYILSKWKDGLSLFVRHELVKSTLWTTIFSFIGKSLGFFIPFFIAIWFGITTETDAFFFVYGLILFLSGIFAPVVENVIVPYIAEARTRNEDTGKFIGNILGASGGVLFAFSIIFLFSVKPMLSALTRFDSQTLNLVYELTIEASPLLILLTWTSVLAGSLNAYQRFALPALSPGFRALIALGMILALKDIYGVHSIALAYVGGELVRLLVLLGTVRRLGIFRIRVSLKLGGRFREFLKTASYQTIGMATVGLMPVVDKTMASWLKEGSVSILYYAERLYMIPVTLVTTGLMVTLLSHWSKRYYESGFERLSAGVKKTVKVVGGMSVAATLMLLLFHRLIVNIAFDRGSFDQVQLSAVDWVWVCYLFGFVPYVLTAVFTRALLTIKNTKILMMCGFYACLLNVSLNYLLMRQFGVKGIALATALVYIFSFLYLGSFFYRQRRTE